MTISPVTTPYARSASLGASDWCQGHLFTWLATGGDTRGLFSLVEAVIRRGLEPPPHIHSTEDEAYYITEGHLDFQVGDQSIAAPAGTFVYLPREVRHGFAVSGESAKAIILITPAGLEEFFREMSEPAQTVALPPVPDGPPDVPKMIARLAQFGVTF